MKEEKDRLNHLIRNLDRISTQNSIFNYENGRKAFSSLDDGNIREWLDTFLPNTRMILEPKIIGSSIAIQYIDGRLKKAINENSKNITKSVMNLKNIPKSLPIKKRIEIQGVLYHNEMTSENHIKTEIEGILNFKPKYERLRFCAFKIYNCNINHFQSLQQLKLLNFEIPQTQFTNFISDIEIYHQYWKEGKLFKGYPTNGIVLKINSRKLQKYLEKNSKSINFEYTIN